MAFVNTHFSGLPQDEVFSGFDEEENKTLQQEIDDAKCLIRSGKHLFPEDIELLVNSLLTSVSMMTETETNDDDNCNTNTTTFKEVKKVADFVLEISNTMQASTVGSVLLSYLDILPQPIPFLEIVPSLFGMASPHQLQEVFNTLKSIDNQFIGPVINAVVDLPLTPEMKIELVSLTETAIHSVDEKDIPFLFRTLLNNLEHISTSNVPGKILKEVNFTLQVHVIHSFEF